MSGGRNPGDRLKPVATGFSLSPGFAAATGFSLSPGLTGAAAATGFSLSPGLERSS